ncbi:MAG: twin transmembrane helix small protein [Pseudomonadota bacterium]|nr:twin transmembrane helix small protein [Pseudomonadota bacterium]
MKIVVVLFLFFILASLASALYYMIKDKGQGTRAVRSLTLRVGLSVLLFALLMLGTYLGFIQISA